MSDRDADPELDRARRAALTFVRDEAHFAQVTTLDRHGYPVTRSMAAFLQPDWSIWLVQRALHHRMEQWRANPRTLVDWVGEPAPGMTNEEPHVFDLGWLPPRLVSVRGDVEIMSPEWTLRVYREVFDAQNAVGNRRAPERTDEGVERDLIGTVIHPVRVRLEGFGEGPQSFQWTVR